MSHLRFIYLKHMSGTCRRVTSRNGHTYGDTKPHKTTSCQLQYLGERQNNMSDIVGTFLGEGHFIKDCNPWLPHEADRGDSLYGEQSFFAK